MGSLKPATPATRGDSRVSPRPTAFVPGRNVYKKLFKIAPRFPVCNWIYCTYFSNKTLSTFILEVSHTRTVFFSAFLRTCVPSSVVFEPRFLYFYIENIHTSTQTYIHPISFTRLATCPELRDNASLKNSVTSQTGLSQICTFNLN